MKYYFAVVIESNDEREGAVSRVYEGLSALLARAYGGNAELRKVRLETNTLPRQTVAPSER